MAFWDLLISWLQAPALTTVNAQNQQVVTPKAVQQLAAVAPVGTLTRAQVEAYAKKITTTYFPNVDWRMLVVMASIESNFKPTAQRKEYNADGSVRDVSYGLVQVLFKTASWVYTDLGARAYGAPTVAKLSQPEASLYYGAAYVNWLRRWNGSARNEEWIVRAYNGGPGWANASSTSKAMTLNHWQKYQNEKKRLYG